MDTLKRQWIGITIGLLALFVALGGPAAATDTAKAAVQQVTGKQIKDGTVTAKDLSKSARKTLKGQRGPAGPRGPAGREGVPGPEGPPGSVQTSPAGGDLIGSYPNPRVGPRTVGVDELEVIPAVRVAASATSVPHDTVTTLNWGDTTSYETVDSMYDEEVGERFSAPVAGLYLAHASVGFNANPDGIRTVAIAINGSNSNPACFDRDQATSTGATFVNATCIVHLNPGEFVTTTVTQTSGEDLTFNGFESASLTWIGNDG